MSDTWSQMLPAIAALSGVAMTFGGTMFLEQQKWRRSRRIDLAIRALDVFTSLLGAVTDLARELQRAAEQLQAGGLPDLTTLATSVDDQLAAAAKLLTTARLIGPASAFSYVDEFERQFTAVRSLIAGTGQAISSGHGTAAAHGNALAQAAQALMHLRDTAAVHLRGPAALHIDLRTPPAAP